MKARSVGDLDPALLRETGGHQVHADSRLRAEALVARGHAVPELPASLVARRLVAVLAKAGLAVGTAQRLAAVLLKTEPLGLPRVELAICSPALASTRLGAGVELLREGHPSQQ